MIIKLHFFYCFLAHFLLESVVCWFIRSIKFSNYPGARHITTKKKRKNQATNDKSPSNNHCFKARFCTCWSLSKQNADLFGQNSVSEKQNSVLTLTKRRSIRNKMKSLKINYLQGCKLLRFGVWKQHKKRGETRKFRPLIEEILFICCLLNNQFLCVGWSSSDNSDVVNAACHVCNWQFVSFACHVIA